MQHRTFSAAVKFVGTVTERQVRVIASDATQDRMGDVLEPHGCDLSNYKKNPVVLAQHDPSEPIARCSSIGVEGGKLLATIEFPPAGISEKSDLYLRLMKAGVVSAVSVGFIPLAWEPIRGAGMRVVQWEILELSVVSVPANPSALVTERAAGTMHYRHATRATRSERAAALERLAARGITPAPQPARGPVAEPEPVPDTRLGREQDLAAIRAKHGLRAAVDPRILVAQAQFRLFRY